MLSNSGKPSEFLGRGLNNPLGNNNCFLNVIIQSLAQLKDFRSPFIDLVCITCIMGMCVCVSMYGVQVRIREARIQELRIRELRIREVRIREARIRELRIREARIQEVRIREVRSRELRIGSNNPGQHACFYVIYILYVCIYVYKYVCVFKNIHRFAYTHAHT
jgi:hypothetical protein